MKYRNTKTGVIIDVQSELKGAWEPVEDPAPEKPAKKTKKTGGKKK